MSTELIVNASLPETRIALMENGEIQELLIERASGKGIVGNIYKGRVTRVLPGMQAAFVDIGLEKAAFLYVDDVYVHSEIWETAEDVSPETNVAAEIAAGTGEANPEGTSPESEESSSDSEEKSAEPHPASVETASGTTEDPALQWAPSGESGDIDDEDLDDEDDSDEPVRMGPPPALPGDEGEGGGNDPKPEGTIAPPASSDPAPEGTAAGAAPSSQPGQSGERYSHRRRHRRGRRGGRFRRREPRGPREGGESTENYPENYHEQVSDTGDMDSDRSSLGLEQGVGGAEGFEEGRPEVQSTESAGAGERPTRPQAREAFRSQRSRDRRIRPKSSQRPVRAQVNIQDLLKEGQEVIVQVAKDPIATKGARLTCHISLPGRHLVCMPTIDHVGVSRRIERDDERRRLRDFVERNRPRNLGFIVRTASGKQSERRITQDIEYLTRLWNEIREKAANVSAPALVYEDLNAVLRAIRDWVTEDIDKIIVDSRYHYNEIQRFVSHFMPPLRQKVELYHGDIPIFDAYGISTELSRALERKVWLKSGGYIVIDQAEALVAIDVNTGRYVGKKNLEDTILKTNLEAVQEIAYQLRLRNCGGIIILDLIDMEKDENKHRVYRALEDALKKDRARPTILKISELGLVEMTRKRTRDTMVRALCESCAHCEGKGFTKSKATVAYEVMREVEREGIERDIGKILVQAHPDVIDILAIDERDTLDQLERRYRKQIYLQAVSDFHPEQFEVVGDKKQKKETGDYNERRPGFDRGRGRDRFRQNQSSHPRIQPKTSESESESESGPESESAATSVSESVSVTNPGQSETAPNLNDASESGNTAPSAHEPYDEEDRLAFLRAQAAQDAALAAGTANLGNTTRGMGSNRPSRDNRSRNDRGDRNDRGRRGRRGGRYRPKGNGGGGKYYGSHGQAGPRPNPSSPQVEAGAGAADTGKVSGESQNQSSGNGGSSNDDHSQPPV